MSSTLLTSMGNGTAVPLVGVLDRSLLLSYRNPYAPTHSPLQLFTTWVGNDWTSNEGKQPEGDAISHRQPVKQRPRIFQRSSCNARVQPVQQRPRLFHRPSRNAKVQQLKLQVDECCSLSFDSVDPYQQEGLTRRMLVFFKALEDLSSYWEGEVQHKEHAFQLLLVPDAGMFAIRHAINSASMLLEERRYRCAYQTLSGVRHWLSGEADLALELSSLSEQVLSTEEKNINNIVQPFAVVGCDLEADHCESINVAEEASSKLPAGLGKFLPAGAAALPIKNTFIHFNLLPAPPKRARSLPSSLDLTDSQRILKEVSSGPCIDRVGGSPLRYVPMRRTPSGSDILEEPHFTLTPSEASTDTSDWQDQATSTSILKEDKLGNKLMASSTKSVGGPCIEQVGRSPRSVSVGRTPSGSDVLEAQHFTLTPSEASTDTSDWQGQATSTSNSKDDRLSNKLMASSTKSVEEAPRKSTEPIQGQPFDRAPCEEMAVKVHNTFLEVIVDGNEQDRRVVRPRSAPARLELEHEKHPGSCEKRRRRHKRGNLKPPVKDIDMPSEAPARTPDSSSLFHRHEWIENVDKLKGSLRQLMRRFTIPGCGGFTVTLCPEGGGLGRGKVSFQEALWHAACTVRCNTKPAPEVILALSFGKETKYPGIKHNFSKIPVFRLPNIDLWSALTESEETFQVTLTVIAVP